MSSGSNLDAAAAESLSALVDGEVDASLAQRVCLAWREDHRSRAAWHAYQLIGDVMRSEDLASTARRDAEFLDRLRARLAEEPVVLAPQPLQAPVADRAADGRLDGLRRRRTWMASTAVAAGFVAVAGVVIVLRGPDAAAPTALVATTGSVSASAPVVAVVQNPPARPAVVPASETEVEAFNGKMVRDARLDRYLAAHKQFAGTSALGVPSSFLRSATVDATNR
jgi:sigma-E factor negative regulatory protein RseA